MHIATKTAVINLVKERTAAYRAEFEEVVLPPVPPVTNDIDAKRIERLNRLITQDDRFGCYTGHVKELVAEITGLPIPFAKRGPKFPILGNFVAIVPLMEFDAHDYPVNDPAVTNSDLGWHGLVRTNGKRGNRLSNHGNDPDKVRPATDEEIADLTDAQIERLLMYGKLEFKE